ncbi:MAG: homoaconitate hydratase [Thermoplasmatales archaeon]|nr:MAG: homoaconitate hydratase [Thermoplasmatales archaeon]
MNDVSVSPYNTLPEVLKDFRLPDNIVIYDSTLRDGEQMPGISFSPVQKLSIARKLDEIGIPEIEAGFPAVSKTEEKTIKTIANEGLNAKILVLSRLKKEDIDAAIRTDADLVLLFIASSPLHLKYKLHCSEQEIKDKVIESIEYSKDHGIIPSFSTEDSTRTPLNFLKELVILADETGAKRIGFTDTVGCATPQAIKYLFSNMRKLVSTPFSAHIHNDFGLGLINAITALSAGATHVCTTINGWGERAGNVPIEQLVMSLKILYKKEMGIDTTKLIELSEMVSHFTGLPIPKMHPMVGMNAFTHESGIHVAAIIENPRTYESISPELVGNKSNILFGKHTGKHLVKQLLDSHGIDADEELLLDIVSQVKQLGERNGCLSDEEIHQIINELTERHRDG